MRLIVFVEEKCRVNDQSLKGRYMNFYLQGRETKKTICPKITHAIIDSIHNSADRIVIESYKY
jgi:hypothetical protein